MAVHNSDQGATWSNMEALSVNEPHGLDYRQHNAIASGVRKRMLKEHVEFTDSTAGGEHLPGVARVINKDTSANIDTSWGSGYLRGSGLQWNPTTGRFYCATIDGSDDGVADMTVIGYSPWADATWTGIHQFNDIPLFKNGAEFSGDVTIKGAFCVTGVSNFWGQLVSNNQLVCNSALACVSNVTLGSSGDGRTVIYNILDVTNTISAKNLVVDNTISANAIKVAGDVSMADISGTVRQRLATAWGRNVHPSTVADGYNVANMDNSSAGVYCVSFTTNLLDANYAVIAIPIREDLEPAGMTVCYSMVVSGFKVKMGSSGGTPQDVSGFSVVVFGGN